MRDPAALFRLDERTVIGKDRALCIRRAGFLHTDSHRRSWWTGTFSVPGDTPRRRGRLRIRPGSRTSRSALGYHLTTSLVLSAAYHSGFNLQTASKRPRPKLKEQSPPSPAMSPTRKRSSRLFTKQKQPAGTHSAASSPAQASQEPYQPWIIPSRISALCWISMSWEPFSVSEPPLR
jgi:hypothetical protein